MKIGYARVSTDDQNLDLQRDALQKAGCEKIYEDVMSGGKTDRPGLARALDTLRAGDTLIVWRLDRLGRSMAHLIATIEQLGRDNIGFASITENIDTTSAGGRLVFGIFASLAEFERALIRERTNAGLTAARARGRKGGRHAALDSSKRDMAVQLYRDQKHTAAEICRTMGISRGTLYNYLAAAGVEQAKS